MILIEQPDNWTLGDEALMEAVGKALGVQDLKRGSYYYSGMDRPETEFVGRYKRAQIFVRGNVRDPTAASHEVSVKVEKVNEGTRSRLHALFLEKLAAQGFVACLW
jgi:hypothetical protein